MRLYVRQESVARSLRLRAITSHLITDEDYFTQWRITALFIHLVLSRCADAGVTPLTARGEVDLTQAFIDTEVQLGIHFTDDEMMMMSERNRRKVIERRLRRRRYSYSVFIRLTSGGILPE